MSGIDRGTQCCVLGCSKQKKKEARSNSEGSIDDNHLSKDNIQGHFTRKLFCFMFFMLGQITIRVRNYSCRSVLAAEVEINIGTKEK